MTSLCFFQVNRLFEEKKQKKNNEHSLQTIRASTVSHFAQEKKLRRKIGKVLR